MVLRKNFLLELHKLERDMVWHGLPCHWLRSGRAGRPSGKAARGGNLDPGQREGSGHLERRSGNALMAAACRPAEAKGIGGKAAGA